jgi:two-component system NtrC family sensor kinase
MTAVNESGHARRLSRLGRSLSAKLIVLLVMAMIPIFALLGFLNIRQHRRDLEAATLLSAERMSDTIKHSTAYHMLRNDRQALYRTINDMSGEPGVARIRIINSEGRISFSTDTSEVNTLVDKNAEACFGCHAQAQPLIKLNRPDRFRIYNPDGHRVLAIIAPIENQPSCSTAACHAHSADQQVLGVLDTHLSLQRADASLAQGRTLMLVYTFVAVLLVGTITGLFVWRFVHLPVTSLKSATERLRHGELGLQLPVHSRDELGELHDSFNQMSRQLQEAREEVDEWTRMLEGRVEDKTRDLKRAHQQMVQAEKMASIGKLAATVAHEINNPLSGILTYAKLLRKWISRQPWDAERQREVASSLELIESESRRCGEIVKGLLTFSRSAPMNLQWTDVNVILDRCVRLVQHKLELNNVVATIDADADLPKVYCDAAQLEQLILALVMNAIDAMPHGGNLTLRSRWRGAEVQLHVQDDGVGIPPPLIASLFEPFFTTKESGHGVGLGLAISKGIVERHHGCIDVDSAPGRGTTFTITLPIDMGEAGQQKQDIRSRDAKPDLALLADVKANRGDQP